MKSRTSLLVAGVLALGASFVLSAEGCSTAPADARIGILAPDRAQFAPVSDLLDHRCGSLDCHGQSHRNLKIYGCEGLRLSDADVPGCRKNGGTNTTQDEYDATYRSLVGLEPAVMSTVVNGKGTRPDLLTFVRKARGAEDHKGGTLIVPGDAQDICIASWLAGATNTDACSQALTSTP